jgi:hypothetical protein
MTMDNNDPLSILKNCLGKPQPGIKKSIISLALWRK